MPLVHCTANGIQSLYGPSPAHSDKWPSRVEVDGRTLTAIDDLGVRLWQQPIPGQIAGHYVQDLDDDERNEVVVAVDGGKDGGRIIAFNSAGGMLWSADANDGRMTIHTFIVARIFRNDARQIIALSRDESTAQSRLSIFDRGGKLLFVYESEGLFEHVAVGRRTPRRAPKIVVSGRNFDAGPALHVGAAVSAVFLLDPKDLKKEPLTAEQRDLVEPRWLGVIPSGESITRLGFDDPNHDRFQDVAITTSRGQILHLDFEGHILAIEQNGPKPLQFQLIAQR